jgi:hypothetical protein
MHLIHKETVIELPKTRIILPSKHLFGGNQVRGILRDLKGNVLQDTGWINNDWTDYGTEHIGTNFGYAMSIGTGTGVTLPGDLDLKNQVHRAQCITLTEVNNGGPTYDFYEIRWHRYNPGEGTGLITEIGMHTANADNTLCCRAEITPIDKQAANVLDMFYRTTCTPDLADKTGQVVIDGITYDWTLRPHDVDIWTQAFGGVVPGNSSNGCAQALNTNPQDSKSCGSGSSTSMQYINSVVDYPNKIRNWSTIAYLTTCNFTLPDGIKSCYTRLGFGQYVGTEGGLGVGFSAVDGPNIGGGYPKDATQYFTVDWNVTWDSA